MANERDFDIKKVIEQGTQRMTLKDLASKGFDNVKVLDEEAVHSMITQAVDRVVSTQTTEQREKILAESRKELDRMLREHKAMRGRAQLLESDKNELVEQVEVLQRELQLKEELEEETLHRKLQEGLASLQSQVEELRKKYAAAASEVETARAETGRLQDDKARLRRESEEAGTKAEEARQTRDAALAEVRTLQDEATRAAADCDRVEKEAEAELARFAELEKELGEQQFRARSAEKARTDLVAQVLKLQSQGEGRAQELKSLGSEVVRQRSELARLGQELEQSKKEAEAFRADLARERDERAAVDQSRAALAAGVESRQAEIARLLGELEKERESSRLADQGRFESGRQSQELEEEIQRLGTESGRLRGDLSKFDEARAELEVLRPRAEKAEREAREAQSEAERLQVERAALSHDAESRKTDLAARDAQVAELSSAAATLREAEVSLRSRVRELEAAAAELEALRPRTEKAEREAAEFRAEAGRLQAEGVALSRDAESRKADLATRNAQVAEFSSAAATLREAEAALRSRVRELEARQEGLDSAAAERDRAREDLDGARQETAFLKGQLAQQQKEHESSRDKTVIVTAELQEIEHQQKEERRDADRLREDQERLARELEAARSEVKALQELLGREQETARLAQIDGASLHARIAEAQSKSEVVEREIETLRVENARLQERLASAKLQERLANIETLLASARQSSAAAKASADRSGEVTSELQRTLLRQQQPKKPRAAGGGSIRGGAAFDGMAVLEGFLRKIRLREHVQKYVPVTERPGRPHASEMMVEVLKSIVAGEGKGAAERKLVPLEIVGPTDAPDAEALREFLGGLSPQAVRALANVHHALRLHLTPLPKKPHPLVLDVASFEVGKGRRTHRPLICFDPVTREFWSGQLRPNRTLAPEAMGEVLKAAIGRVPAPFARARIRLRMDEGFFNEGVVRLLESKGVSYVIAAPDSPGLRKQARGRAFHKLSNGWEVGEFAQRLHPIRRTQARFVVLRRRMSKIAKEAGPGTFRDERHVYHVFATDRRATPWRSFEFFQARPEAIEDARSRLSDFATSPLLGRSRRSVAALFQAHLLASDLVQWFRRSCLPEEERSRELADLRSEFLWTPPKSGTRSVLVLPRRDRRRRLFSRVTRLTRRVRPARPFRYRS
jgi:chromosome segregation ATPase